MDAAKRGRLEEAGFQVGTVADFLGLSAEEREMVESKAALDASSIMPDELDDVIGDHPNRRQGGGWGQALPLRSE